MRRILPAVLASLVLAMPLSNAAPSTPLLDAPSEFNQAVGEYYLYGEVGPTEVWKESNNCPGLQRKGIGGCGTEQADTFVGGA